MPRIGVGGVGLLGRDYEHPCKSRPVAAWIPGIIGIVVMSLQSAEQPLQLWLNPAFVNWYRYPFSSGAFRCDWRGVGLDKLDTVRLVWDA